MLSFIPFYRSAVQRSDAVEDWIWSWLGNEAELLKPEGWFERGHGLLGEEVDDKGFWRHAFKPRKFIWAPPPAAASVALEELCKARIKQQDSMHVFVCPRLLKPEWFWQLYKAADLVFDVPAGASCWSKQMFEPLIIGVVFPFLRNLPWQLRLTPKMFSLERGMRGMWEDPGLDPGDLLRKFYWSMKGYAPCQQMWCGECYFLSQEIEFHLKQRAIDEDGNESNPMHRQQMQAAWGKKQQAPDDFLRGRDGDHAMVPFECDLCIFRKLRDRSPDPSSPPDKLLQACIRRVSLDAFWSWATATVRGNRDKIAQAIGLSKTVGLLGPCEAKGPLPEVDHCGYEVAIKMVLQSRRPGRYSPDYTQFDIIR
jgi:hypothetical protein